MLRDYNHSNTEVVTPELFTERNWVGKTEGKCVGVRAEQMLASRTCDSFQYLNESKKPHLGCCINQLKLDHAAVTSGPS